MTLDRIKKYSVTTCHDLKLFDVRIIFLSTALNDSIRTKVNKDLQGDIILIELLDQIFKQSNNFNNIEVT